eukprot:365429-Chlamydomonas_euryale.AAC.19
MLSNRAPASSFRLTWVVLLAAAQLACNGHAPADGQAEGARTKLISAPAIISGSGYLHRDSPGALRPLFCGLVMPTHSPACYCLACPARACKPCNHRARRTAMGCGIVAARQRFWVVGFTTTCNASSNIKWKERF